MSDARSGHFRGLALMAVSAGSFAANALLIRGLGRYLLINVWFLTSLRFAVGILVVIACFGRGFAARHLMRNRLLVERGVVGALGVLTYYAAIVHVGAARSTFINSTYVFWAALMAAAAFHERLRPVTVAGAIAGVVGVGLLTDVFAGGPAPNGYDLLAVLSALGSAYVAVTIRKLHETENTATIFGAQCAYGLVLCGPPAAVHTQVLPAGAWLLALLSALCVAAGQLSQTRAYRDVPVAEGTLVQMLCPLGTAFGGMLFFREHLTAAEMGGAALILVGSATAAIRRPAESWPTGKVPAKPV